ncbi:MAG: hypothetical protein M0Z43_04840 [Acidithiobacillus sp.]|nr:hypothetical protein [Acidithiobacillus sp.]
MFRPTFGTQASCGCAPRRARWSSGFVCARRGDVDLAQPALLLGGQRLRAEQRFHRSRTTAEVPCCIHALRRSYCRSVEITRGMASTSSARLATIT